MTVCAQNPEARSPAIAVIGAGIIGLSSTLELAARGAAVTLYDRQWPPQGASWAAAGMLAPAFEAAGDDAVHPKLFELCRKSAAMWPAWAERLQNATGRDAGYRPGPSLAVAMTADEAARLARISARLSGSPDAPQLLGAEDRRQFEPNLSDHIDVAYMLPSDGQVDNRATMRALIKMVEGHDGVTVRQGEPPLRMNSGRLDHAGHDATLVCAGWGTPVVGVEANGERVDLLNWATILSEIDTYGGQMLSVAPVPGGPRRTIRAGDLYIVPKADRIVIGATTHPGEVIADADPQVVAGLKARAAALFPVLADAPVIESWAGVRPGTRNHAPLLGQVGVDGLYVASGHYRNGILLAPVTANIMADMILAGKIDALAASFSPHCFA